MGNSGARNPAHNVIPVHQGSSRAQGSANALKSRILQHPGPRRPDRCYRGMGIRRIKYLEHGEHDQSFYFEYWMLNLIKDRVRDRVMQPYVSMLTHLLRVTETVQ
jgi:hypothetical protein